VIHPFFARQMIRQLQRDLPRAAEFEPADWAQAVLIRNAVYDYEEHGGRLSLDHRLSRALSDDVFMDYAAAAWEAFADTHPEFAEMDHCWWDRLRSSAGQPSSAAAPSASLAEPSMPSSGGVC